MRRVIFTPKGGVGKSSIACNLAAVSAHRGLRTLVIDLDIQGNATEYLLERRVGEVRDTVEDLFEQTLALNFLGKKSPESYVHRSRFPNLSVMPAGPSMDVLAGRLEARQKIYKFRDALRELGARFDRIYVDTPPAVNFYTRSALIAADRVLVPFDCDDFSRQALYAVIETIRELREDHNPTLMFEGVVVNQYQPGAKLPRQLLDELEAEGLPLLPVKLASSVKMRESHQEHTPLVHLAPKHKLTAAFEALHEHLHSASGAARRAV
jgi:chromosome partitioning protein